MKHRYLKLGIGLAIGCVFFLHSTHVWTLTLGTSSPTPGWLIALAVEAGVLFSFLTRKTVLGVVLATTAFSGPGYSLVAPVLKQQDSVSQFHNDIEPIYKSRIEDKKQLREVYIKNSSQRPGWAPRIAEVTSSIERDETRLMELANESKPVAKDVIIRTALQLGTFVSLLLVQFAALHSSTTPIKELKQKNNVVPLALVRNNKSHNGQTNETLRKSLTETGVSLRTISTETGVSPSTLSRFINGATVRSETLVKLQHYLQAA